MTAAELGYKNIYVYHEGIPVWEEMGHPIVKGPDYEAKIETVKLAPLENTIQTIKEETVLEERDKESGKIIEYRKLFALKI